MQKQDEGKRGGSRGSASYQPKRKAAGIPMLVAGLLIAAVVYGVFFA